MNKENKSIYELYYELDFNRIYWSRLVSIHIDKNCGEYRCNCCNKEPHKCNNIKSAKEYDKIRRIMEVEIGFMNPNYLYPITQTGWLRADLFATSKTIWKIQRELAKSAGFKLKKSSFW